MKNKTRLNLIKNIIKDSERKSVFLIIKDLIELNKTNSIKEMRYYFLTLMYKKDAGDIHKYVNDNVLLRILKYNSKQGNWYLLANKLRFIEKMEELPGSVPTYLGKIEKGLLYDKEGNNIPFKNRTDLLAMLDKLIQNHKTLFIKGVESSGGKDIFRIKETTVFNLNELNLNQDYLIEAGLTQVAAIIPCIVKLQLNKQQIPISKRLYM